MYPSQSGRSGPVRGTCTYRWPIPFHCLLYVISEEGGEHYGRPDHKEDRSQKRHDVLHDLPLLIIDLDVDYQGRDDGHDTAYGIAHVQHIKHHRDREVMRPGQGACSPRIVDPVRRRGGETLLLRNSVLISILFLFILPVRTFRCRYDFLLYLERRAAFLQC